MGTHIQFKGLFILSAIISLISESTYAKPQFLQFPRGFKWCTATAAHQIEGYNTESDWWNWEQLPGKIKGGDRSVIACDHWNRVDQDIQMMKDLHLNQYRFSIEWAKIEPREGQWDWEAIHHYQNEVRTLLQNGIEPLITLHHFTAPRWFTEKGGWEWEGSAGAFSRFAEMSVKKIAPQVHDWITFNEPTVFVLGSYFAGLMPPGEKRDFKSVMGPLKGMLKAHAAAYATMKRTSQTPIRIGIAYHLRIFEPYSKLNPLDWKVAKALDHANNWAFGEALETGTLKIKIPFLANIEEAIPDLKGTQDFIGVNYYTRDLVHFSLTNPNHVEIKVKDESFKSDLGWEIYPEGIYRLLKATAQRFPNSPILITENGIADAHDRYRINFIEDHLAYVHRAITEGIPVEGYCHWTLMDNFEWTYGFGPRFGLFEMDYSNQKRTPRPSAMRFSEIARDNGFIYPN